MFIGIYLNGMKDVVYVQIQIAKEPLRVVLITQFLGREEKVKNTQLG